MAARITLTAEQRKVQGEIIQEQFGLSDYAHVSEDFSMESSGTGALLTVTLVRIIDLQTASEPLNGRRRDESSSGYNELVCESKPLIQAHSVELKDDPEGES